MNRRLVVVPLLAATLFGLAACNSSTGGTGSPNTAQSGSNQTGPTGNVGPTSSGDASGASTSIQPCDLLNSADASQLQLTKGGPVNEGAARGCTWQRAVDINGNGFAVEIGVRDSQGLGDINSAGSTVTPDPIGKHQGKQAAQTVGGGCLIALAITSSSRVDVQVTGSNDATQTCAFANQVAQAVEPQLPGGN